MSSSLTKLKLTKKIDSPLAKYNSVGQLFCVLCNSQVKNEMYWTGHVNGKEHRDNLGSLKKKKDQQQNSSNNNNKRPASESNDGSKANKIARVGGDDEHVFKKPDGDHVCKVVVVKDQEVKLIAEALLVRDEEEKKQEVEVQEDVIVQQKSLPQGFFDDPKEDAKARGVKFKDPQDAEWDLFVREIASEDVKSSEMVGVDQEVSAVERELDQIEEQMAQWQRVIELEKKAEEWNKGKRKERNDDDGGGMDVDNEKSGGGDDDEDDDVEYDEEMDWRNKKR